MPDLKEARIAFAALPWESPLEGMRVKRFERDGKSVRLVEFADPFVEPVWCEKGHCGLVLEGALTLEMIGGQREQLVAGEGLYLPATPEGRHKAVIPKGGRALLLLVEG